MKNNRVHYTQRVSLFQNIPTELFHLILLYSAEQFPDVLRFRAVCRECREVGNYSVFWLTCELSFWRVGDRLVAGKPAYTEIEIDLNDDDKAILQKLRKSQTSVHLGIVSVRRPTSLNPIADYNNVLTGRPREQAFDISQRFLKIFLRINRIWSKQVQNARFYESLQPYLAYVINAFEYLTISRILLFMAAIGLLWEFPNYSQRPISLPNQMGFLCLYLILFQYFFYALALLATKVIHYLLISHYSSAVWDVIQNNTYAMIFPTVGAVVVVLGVTVFLILLQLLFSSRSISFPFDILSVPIWFITVSGTLLAQKMIVISRRNESQRGSNHSAGERSALCFLSVSIHVFPLTILLTGLYYDFPNSIRSLEFVMIPVYPFQFALITYFVLSLQHSVKVWKTFREDKVFSYNEGRRMTLFKLFVNNFRNLLLFGMLFAMLFLDVTLFLSDSSWCSFENVFRSFLFFLLFLHVYVYLSPYDPGEK
jgi:hypothetical protein